MPRTEMPRSVPVTVYRPWLDGVRGIAVLLVVAEHGGQAGGLSLPAGLGETGVGLFFGLSGYLITGLLLDEAATSGRVDFKAFYIRRAARLLPALLLMLGGSCVLFVRLGSPEVLLEAVYVLSYLANYATVLEGDYLVAFGQTWSLAIEEHFYLIWPAVVVLLLTRRGIPSLLRWTLLGCAAALLWRWVLIFGIQAPELLIYHGSLERVDALLYGCAAALAVRTGWRPRRWMVWGAVGALATVVVVTDSGAIGMSLVQAVIGISSAALVVGLDYVPGLLRRALSLAPIVGTGLVSYGIYLWHWPLLIAVPSLGDAQRSALASAMLGLILTAVVATLSYITLERPVRAWVRRWLARSGSAAATGPSSETRPPGGGGAIGTSG